LRAYYAFLVKGTFLLVFMCCSWLLGCIHAFNKFNETGILFV
jgi:hypothetical protein